MNFGQYSENDSLNLVKIPTAFSCFLMEACQVGVACESLGNWVSQVILCDSK